MHDCFAFFFMANIHKHYTLLLSITPKVWYPARKIFFEKRPKSFYGKLFTGMHLGSILQRMSNTQSFPKDLKDQECKKGNVARPPILYVLEMDEVQEMVQESCKNFYKIKLEDKTEFSITIWDTGTNQQFLNHVTSALNACFCQGYLSNHNKTVALIHEELAESDDLANLVVAAKQVVDKKERPNKKKEKEEKAQKPAKTHQVL